MSIIITVPGTENFDEIKQQFVYSESVELMLEHSLVSLSKWESIHEKPFLGHEKKTSEETLSYIQCMCLTDNVDSNVFYRLTEDNVKVINEYIESKMTATTFREGPQGRSREIITNELIRAWMVSFQIPLDYETRHLNQLFTLIKVMNELNKPKKKMSQAELAARNRELNEQRRKMYGTTG